MLQREMMSSPFLASYGVIILDDAHERSIATDVLLGLLKDVLLARPELKLVVCSSPHLAGRLHTYYGDAPLLEVRHTCPVEVVHLGGSADGDSFQPVLHLIFDIHRSGDKGDIVVFLAGEQVSVPKKLRWGEGSQDRRRTMSLGFQSSSLGSWTICTVSPRLLWPLHWD